MDSWETGINMIRLPHDSAWEKGSLDEGGTAMKKKTVKVDFEAASYYRLMYAKMFNAATEALKNLESYECCEDVYEAMECLRKAQSECEEIYISSGDDEDCAERGSNVRPFVRIERTGEDG